MAGTKSNREQGVIDRERVASAIIPEDPTVLLDEYQAAKIMGCSVHKLRRDRWAGGGVQYVKLSDHGTVRYRRIDIDTQIAARIRRSTSDTGNRAA